MLTFRVHPIPCLAIFGWLRLIPGTGMMARYRLHELKCKVTLSFGHTEIRDIAMYAAINIVPNCQVPPNGPVKLNAQITSNGVLFVVLPPGVMPWWKEFAVRAEHEFTNA